MAVKVIILVSLELRRDRSYAVDIFGQAEYFLLDGQPLLLNIRICIRSLLLSIISIAIIHAS